MERGEVRWHNTVCCNIILSDLVHWCQMLITYPQTLHYLAHDNTSSRYSGLTVCGNYAEKNCVIKEQSNLALENDTN